MEITKVIGALKKGRTTSEFAAAAVAGIFAGGAAIGLFDAPPPEVVSVIAGGAGGVVETVQQVQDGSVTIMNGLLKIVGLIIGGNVISTYIKSRSSAKSDHTLSISNALALVDTKHEEPKPSTIAERGSLS